MVIPPGIEQLQPALKALLICTNLCGNDTWNIPQAERPRKTWPYALHWLQILCEQARYSKHVFFKYEPKHEATWIVLTSALDLYEVTGGSRVASFCFRDVKVEPLLECYQPAEHVRDRRKGNQQDEGERTDDANSPRTDWHFLLFVYSNVILLTIDCSVQPCCASWGRTHDQSSRWVLEASCF